MLNSDKIVCFDIGGVLVRIRHSWDQAMSSVGLDVTESHKAPLGGFEEFLRYQEGLIPAEAYIERLAEQLGVTAQQASETHAAILDADYQGAYELVSSLKANNVFTCCFSNTNGLHWERLASPEFHPAVALLDARFASHELGVAKPLQESFAEVESRLPDHSRVIFFDDTMENVRAARDAGWTSFQIDVLGDPVTQMRATLQKLRILD